MLLLLFVLFQSVLDNSNDDDDLDVLNLSFKVDCPHCGQAGNNEMCQIDIPGFRKCIIMAFNCSGCGSRSNEVKAMGTFGSKGRRWTLKVTAPSDLNRDVLKSDTASVTIPELEIDVCFGALAGVYTTVEGLIMKVRIRTIVIYSRSKK